MRIGILLYSIAAALAAVAWPLAVVILVAIQLVYIVPGHIDQHRWRPKAL
jgi:hypothetical protein